MAAASVVIIFLSAITFLPLSASSELHAHPLKTRLFKQAVDPPDSATTYFEVIRPIKTPQEPPCSSTLVLQHDFGYTFGQPPVEAQYTPPRDCPSADWSTVVLEWSATSKGRQFDRIFGVWLGRVEILRSCTAEPRPNGIFWKVQKEITRFSSLLKQNQTLSVHLANIVDNTYTGIYHVNVTIHFYAEKGFGKRLGSRSILDSPADLILPISRSPPLNDGYWFLVQNSTDVQQKQFSIPRNVYRAVLEVFVSYHSNDEFWYTNPPDEYIQANNLSSVPGSGAFREVVVSLDNRVVGAVWPFTVIYTGGVNPLLWRPITGIGSFDLPSYDIEITPFLGLILDKENHTLEFSVTNALNVWYIDANLHLWIDGGREKTKCKLLSYDAPPARRSILSELEGLDGIFNTSASRYIAATGRVKTSQGKIYVHTVQRFAYRNWMKFGNNGSAQIVRQRIKTDSGVYFTLPSDDLYSIQLIRNYPLYLYTSIQNQINESYTDVTSISLGFNENSFRGEESGFSFSSLRNRQDASGYIAVLGNLVKSGLGRTKEVYSYESKERCYFRNVSSSNYTILYDFSSPLCSRRLPI